MKREKRTYERRIPTGNVYAAIGSFYEKVGKLIDLSAGGLAFEYMSNNNPITEFSQIDILKVGGVANLQNLTCRTVYDVTLPLAQDGIKSLKHSHNRRCGVEFKNLREEDNVQLAMFLESHTKAGH